MIGPLTSLRFLFALMVLLHHLVPGVHPFFYEGFVGVSFFFMLSGFVLTYSYENKIAKGEITKKDFYIARLARIYPLHLLTLIIFILLSSTYAFSITNNLKLIVNALLSQSFIPLKQIYFSFNAVSWSISVEMFFYLLFPFLLLFLYRSKRLVDLALLVGGLGIVAGLNFFLDDNYRHAVLYINPFIRLFDFIWGILLYKYWKILRKKNISLKLASIGEIFSIFLFVAFLFCSQYVEISYRYSIYYWPVIILIIFIFAFQSGVISRLLSFKPLVLLGEASFGLYMIHTLCIRHILPIFKDSQIPLRYGLLCIILLCIFLSIISFYFFEKPMNRYVKRIFKYHNAK